jgi:proliferating cell nuclear antigen
MRVLELKTTQSSIFKILIEALKEVVVEANLIFTSEKMKIAKTNVTETVLINVELKAENFAESGFYKYNHNQEQLVVGINIMNLFKLLKTLNNDDILTFYIDDENMGVLNIRLENNSKATVTKYQLSLIDINEETIEIPQLEFDTIITYNATNFQKIIKDMSNLHAKHIDIKSYNKQLIFTGQGDFATQETTIGEDTDDIKFNKNTDAIFQGKYLTSNLTSFTKCTNLCNNITMKLKNDFPLVITYTAGSLGRITLLIAPKNEE